MRMAQQYKLLSGLSRLPENQEDSGFGPGQRVHSSLWDSFLLFVLTKMKGPSQLLMEQQPQTGCVVRNWPTVLKEGSSRSSALYPFPQGISPLSARSWSHVWCQMPQYYSIGDHSQLFHSPELPIIFHKRQRYLSFLIFFLLDELPFCCALVLWECGTAK